MKIHNLGQNKVTVKRTDTDLLFLSTSTTSHTKFLRVQSRSLKGVHLKPQFFGKSQVEVNEDGQGTCLSPFGHFGPA